MANISAKQRAHRTTKDTNNNRNEQGCLCKFATISATKRAHRTTSEEEEQSQRARLLMQVGQHFCQKTGPPHHKKIRITIATSKAVGASLPRVQRAHRTTRVEE
jgi:hypothetical protein